MIGINIITVGKLKEEYWRLAEKEYLKRLSPFCKIKVTELNEYKISDSPSAKEIENGLEAEGEAMTTYLNAKGSFNIAMCIEGRKFSSDELSKSIEKCGVEGFSIVNFFIGSSFGLSEKVKGKCNMRLSMSDMTFPHQLARIMLLEQVYRAFQISKGTKYHK